MPTFSLHSVIITLNVLVFLFVLYNIRFVLMFVNENITI